MCFGLKKKYDIFFLYDRLLYYIDISLLYKKIFFVKDFWQPWLYDKFFIYLITNIYLYFQFKSNSSPLCSDNLKRELGKINEILSDKIKFQNSNQ